MDQYSRTAMLIGQHGISRLRSAHVILFGVGGVGGYVAETLVRSGLGALDLVDRDCVSITNLNRQIIATHRTLGMSKTRAMAERLRDISPEARIVELPIFYLPETAEQVDFAQYDYVVDAVDTVTAKLLIIQKAREAGVPVISAMGAGNKLDPTQLRTGLVEESTICPLARVMRRELKRRGISGVRAVWSVEPARTPLQPPEQESDETDEPPTRKDVPGSVAWVPAAMGLVIAGEVIRELTGV